MHTVLTGESNTSFEQQANIHVDVLEGDHIMRHLPWLFDLYQNDFLHFVRQSFGSQIYCSNEQNSAININKISGIGARYEWHLDTNDITGLLFVDDFFTQDGGELLFKKGKNEFALLPKRGLFICFLTAELPHAVLPLRLANKARLSIPMNYYFDKNNTGRDPQVHQYLTRKT